MSKNKGKIHIYTGDGKGKTTAGLGLAIRAIGHGLKVGIVYFDKGGDYYNERKILDKLKNQGLEYKAFGESRMTKKKGFRFKNEPADLQEASRTLDQVQIWMQQDFDILILDEINTTVKTELLKLEDLIHLIKQKPENLELVLTGRYCPPEIMKYGDLITEMKMIKHYLSTGLPARPGIEF
jgi:cob(I)alamin adenosyltransferase